MAKPSQPLAPTVWIAVAVRRGSAADESNMRRVPATSRSALAASATPPAAHHVVADDHALPAAASRSAQSR